jgi:hypothetical protein
MTAIAAGAHARAKGRLSFYSWMALAFVATAFLGFVPTYWQRLAAGSFKANPVVHLHGLAFFAWTLFFFYQSTLPPTGQVARHRAVGLVGISLATLMTMLGVLAALNSLNTAVALGAASAGEAFTIVPLSAILFFAVLIIVAIANIRRPEVHKRLLIVATASILTAPLARPFLAWVFRFPPGPPPVWFTVWPNGLADLFVIAAMAYDWRTRGRIHPVYLWAGGALAAVQLLCLPVSETAFWHSLARDFLQLAGSTPARPV